ncbi:Pyruvate kinase isozyme G, chloroplastic [Auxenochlorella protothecoides]|uniref:Pyruvate kinase n=1 Tax=Auxenochlorella protothecoides TaxID=3075 RepID=A0A087SU66_AUXPR|nr:Pyruvate kinase isozyme G, chloroplastic [Auxenochlorella protothecoides]KFM29270.1 Pyruvate kinase isozyme G, chloroplastic [Auxenochlorella protothecoides]
MLEVSSADTLCRWMGYAKAGSVRETTLHVLGLSVGAIKMSPFEVINERSTKIMVSVECLKAGQKACTADKNGNIGTGNKGNNNFGDYNDGNNNIGNSNMGDLNWGYNNKGTNLRCNNAIGTRKVLNMCSLKELGKSCSVSTVRPFGAFSPHQAGTRRPAHTAARVLCTATPPVNRGGGRPEPSRPTTATSAVAGYAKGISLSPSLASQQLDDEDGEYSLNAPPRKTKTVCTIGPTSCDREAFFRLADSGMNVVRLNMSHGDHASHQQVIDLVREYNAMGRRNLAIMLDTKGPEVRSGDVTQPLELRAGETVTFTIVAGADGTNNRIGVNYDGFIDDVELGDILLVDGGIMSAVVRSKTDTDVVTEIVDGGSMKSRRHLNIRGKSANLPAITDRDWADIRFGLEQGVDYYALSFVRTADVIYELKDWLARAGATGTSAIGVLAKIESADSVANLDAILDAVDGAMVARGDLGAELPVEEVPYWQSKIVRGCRKRGKPVIVATNMLESMIKCPTPTRAEVSDIAIAVREGADAVMLSGETAHGSFPFKSLDVMAMVARRTERAMLSYEGARRYGSEESDAIDWIMPPSRSMNSLSDVGISEMFAYHAVTMANTIRTSLVVFSRKGHMPALLSHYRPDYPIYCFTENEAVQRRMALLHGVTAIYTRFSEKAAVTFDAAIEELKQRGYVKGGQLVAIVQSGRQPIWRSSSTHSIAVRAVPRDVVPDDSDEEEEEKAKAKAAKVGRAGVTPAILT